MGERMSAVLPEAMLGEGQGAVRALIVDGGNPVNALAGTHRAAEAFAAIPLLVSIDPFLNETSRLAHYILPPPMMLERADIRNRDWESYTLHQPFSQFAEPMTAPPAGAVLIDDWRVFWELARRTGHAISFDGVPIAMDEAPSPDSLFRILLRHSAFPADALLAETRGGIFEGEPVLIGPADADAPCFQVAPPDIVAELAALAGTRRQATALRLVCGRVREVQNSMYHGLPSIARRMTTNPLALNPDDMSERSLKPGEEAWLSTARGRIRVTVQADATLRRGVATIAHGWGDGRGVNVNTLTSLGADRQTINAMPILSGFDVEVRACTEPPAARPA